MRDEDVRGIALAKEHKAGNGRLREQGARQILSLRKAGYTYQAISQAMDVCVSTVYNVCTGRTWAFLRDDQSGN